MGIRGTINVFVALMMIPTIAFTGLMVDFARLQMASVEINNAADLAASSAIAYYDGLLQDVYGLYATSQNSTERQKFGEEYARAALGLDKNGSKAVSSLNLFSTGKTKNPLKVEMKGYPEYSLKNTAYLKYELLQYMKYRVAFSIMEMFNAVTANQSTFANADKSESMANKDQEFASEDYNDICMEMDEIKRLYTEACDEIKKVQDDIGQFNSDTTESLGNIKEAYDQLDSEIRDGYFLNTNVIYDEICDTAEGVQSSIDDYKERLNNIKRITDEIESRTNALSGKIDTAKNKLIAGKGTDYSDLFVESILGQLDEDKQKLVLGVGSAGSSFLSSNASKFDDIKYGSYTIDNRGSGTILSDVRENSFNCGGSDMRTLVISENPLVNISISPFDTDKYNKMKEALDSSEAYDQSYIEDLTQSYTQQASASHDTSVSHDKPKLSGLKIPSNYKDETGSWKDSETDDGVLANLTINRLLLVEYGVQMFSNYVTNRYLEGGKYIDEKTLSGIPFTTKMNYMYGAELEYIYWGSDNAQTNYNAVIITLSAVFASRNLAFTFTDNYIKGEIALIRAIPYVGWALAEAYRASIVALETWRDIDTLINGKKVPLIKKANMTSKCHWRTSIHYTFQDAVLGNSAWGPWGQKGEGTGMYYYEYLRQLILFNFFAGNDTIAHRISTLIELNMNNYMNGNNGGVNKPLTNLSKFKMNKAFVVVDAKLTGSVPYFFISMPFLAEKVPDGDTRKMGFEVVKTRSY